MFLRKITEVNTTITQRCPYSCYLEEILLSPNLLLSPGNNARYLFPFKNLIDYIYILYMCI